MTPEQFEKIALWMGWRKGEDYAAGFWFNTKDQVVGPANRKTSLTPAEAVEALMILEQRGYEWELHGRDGQVECIINRQFPTGELLWVMEEDHPTIALAVEAAILVMLEKEGER